MSFWCRYCQLWTNSIHFSSVSIFDFEQVNTGRKKYFSKIPLLSRVLGAPLSYHNLSKLVVTPITMVSQLAFMVNLYLYFQQWSFNRTKLPERIFQKVQKINVDISITIEMWDWQLSLLVPRSVLDFIDHKVLLE